MKNIDDYQWDTCTECGEDNSKSTEYENYYSDSSTLEKFYEKELICGECKHIWKEKYLLIKVT